MIVDYENFKISCVEDRFINEVLIGKEYEFSKKDKVIIDLGANIGTYSIYAYDDAKIIYAIEPSDEYKLLAENINNNNLTKIIPFNIALGKENTTMTLYSAHGTGSGTLYASSEYEQLNPKEVIVKTLATFIKENGIKYVDWLKIDVEKAEIDVFSASDFKDVSSRIGLIFGEKHGNEDSLTDILRDAGFTVDIMESHFIARHI